MGQRVFRSEIVRRIRIAHDRCKAEGRDIDAFDVVRFGAERRDGFLECIERGIDRIAARPQAKPVSRDFPAGAELIEQAGRLEPVADQAAQRFLDRVVLCGKACQRKIGRKPEHETAHPPGHVQRGRTGDGVVIARREDESSGDTDRPAYIGRVQSPQSRSRGSSAQQRRLTVLVCERPGRHRRTEAGAGVIPEDQGCEHVAAGASSPFADAQHARQNLHRALIGNVPIAFSQLQGPSGDAVQQGRVARIVCRPARRQYGRARPRGRAQSLAQPPHLGPTCPCENDTDRIEHDQLRMPLHFLRHLLERRLSDETSEFFDLLLPFAFFLVVGGVSLPSPSSGGQGGGFLPCLLRSRTPPCPPRKRGGISATPAGGAAGRRRACWRRPIGRSRHRSRATRRGAAARA